MAINKKRYLELLIYLVKAIVRCLYNIKGSINLKDLTKVTRAEAQFIINELLYNIKLINMSRGLYSEEMENNFDNEIHSWTLYLVENDKLIPRNEYHRLWENLLKINFFYLILNKKLFNILILTFN